MSFTSYSDLQTTIAGYLARTDLTTQIPDFIRLAETRLRRDLRILEEAGYLKTTQRRCICAVSKYARYFATPTCDGSDIWRRPRLVNTPHP